MSYLVKLTKNRVWQFNLSYKKMLLGFSLALFLLLTPLLAACIGAMAISPEKVLSTIVYGAHDLNGKIILELRLPRIALAFIAGAGLSLAGAVLQLATRNPLADPYLFGISSGASFGAVLTMALSSIGFSFVISDLSFTTLSLPIGAFIGALLSVLLVFGLSGSSRANQVERMLLSGVACSFMFAALSSLVLYFCEPQAAAAVLFWSLGSFARATWSQLWLPSVIVSLSLLVLLASKRKLLALQAGDETAHTLGINVPKFRLGMLLICSLMTATLVASCGGIGFVGLMVPHLIRMLMPGRQPLLLTAIAGGTFMIWVDVLARTLLANQELPVGIITASVGSVFFLYILHRRGRDYTA